MKNDGGNDVPPMQLLRQRKAYVVEALDKLATKLATLRARLQEVKTFAEEFPQDSSACRRTARRNNPCSIFRSHLDRDLGFFCSHHNLRCVICWQRSGITVADATQKRPRMTRAPLHMFSPSVFLGDCRCVKDAVHDSTRNLEYVVHACSDLEKEVTDLAHVSVTTLTETLSKHYLYLLVNGTKGPVDLESELKRLDACSETLKVHHRESLFPLTANPMLKQLFVDFRFISEDLHNSLVQLFDLSVAFRFCVTSGTTRAGFAMAWRSKDFRVARALCRGALPLLLPRFLFGGSDRSPAPAISCLGWVPMPLSVWRVLRTRRT